MNFRKKTSNVTKVLYIILAMCIISIVSLTLYSLFNQNDTRNDSLNLLHNHAETQANNADAQNQEAEDALANRQRTTEAPATTAAAAPPPATTPRRTAAPPPAAPAPPALTPGEADAPQQRQPEPEEPVVRQPVTAAPPVATVPPPPAFSPDDETMEDSVEVMAVPEIAANSFIRPLSGHISRLHRPDIAEFSLAMNDFRTHTGIDIDGEIGANVRAVADGVITEIRDDPLMGKTVVIEHAGGFTSVYQNLQPMIPQNITAGAQVSRGDVIGGVGQTALIEMMDVPHLHFEMLKDGVHVDPFDYIDFN